MSPLAATENILCLSAELYPRGIRATRGETVLDEATRPSRFSPFAPAKQPELASCPSAKLSPLGMGTSSLLCCFGGTP